VHSSYYFSYHSHSLHSKYLSSSQMCWAHPSFSNFKILSGIHFWGF
jgi:hypothetical protein